MATKLMKEQTGYETWVTFSWFSGALVDTFWYLLKFEMDTMDDFWHPRPSEAWIGYYKRPKNWRPIRFTGRFRKASNDMKNFSKKLESQIDWPTKPPTEEYPSCMKQFHNYCRVTTMHGIRYIAEEKRHPSEKVFWACWCIFGISAAIYMMSKIYTRWESSPVITSVSNTNFPVTNINFPAVTICTVNKAVNEKMIIQACNYNITLSKMRSILSQLVDPEARNNDHIQVNPSVNPKLAMKYLRLVAPKCEDYLLTCRWNGATAKCSNLFKLTLTDTGYCCTFNAIEARVKKSEGKNEAEVQEQESNYSFLQKAVWDYTDIFREKNGVPDDTDDFNTTGPVPDAFTCQRVFDDDLFPGICRYLKKCKENPKRCRLTKPLPTPSMLGGSISDKYPLKALGAGRSRGLTLMLDTLRCDAVPTDSFKGLRVLVHDPEEFPAVGERGFIVGPGMETQVAVTATDTFSAEVLRAFAAKRRGCYFSDEFPLKYYKEYSRSSCVLECENNYIHEKCGCVPYYAPGNYSDFGVCSVEKIQGCVRNAITNIAVFKAKQPAGEEQIKSCTEFCLPACNETFYNFVVTAATFPNQPEPNMTQMLREAITEKREHLNNISYVSASISVLRVFFRESSIMQYKRDELFTWEDFVSNLGGVMGLCLGFSLLSLVEIIYFFTMRFFVDWRRCKHAHPVPSDIFGTSDFIAYH